MVCDVVCYVVCDIVYDITYDMRVSCGRYFRKRWHTMSKGYHTSSLTCRVQFDAPQRAQIIMGALQHVVEQNRVEFSCCQESGDFPKDCCQSTRPASLVVRNIIVWCLLVQDIIVLQVTREYVVPLLRPEAKALVVHDINPEQAVLATRRPERACWSHSCPSYQP